uniref:Metalloendopeptidase n=1 Tax=Strongyloides papillosus TaxID=174720 RepID=A0A0N5CAL3_STREA
MHMSGESYAGHPLNEKERIIYPPPYPTDGREVSYYYEEKLLDLFKKLKGYPDVEEIDEIFYQINNYTCFNFTKSQVDIKNKIGIYFCITQHNDHVRLSNDDNKPTYISLKEETYKDIFKIRFYLGLAFGLIPEIQRIDRDRELQIDYDNISLYFKPYFNKSNYYYKFIQNTDYDFASATHFPNDFGSKGLEITYKPFNCRYEEMLKANRLFVYSDFRKINNIYCKCLKKNSCEHGGYYSKKNCMECQCPSIFTGKNCENLIETKEKIGCNNGNTEIKIKKDEKKEGEVTIKNIKEDCYISITAEDKNKVVQITVKSAEIINFDGCIMNPRGEIKYRKDKGVEGLYIQYNVSNPFKLKALSNEVFIKFHDYFSRSSLKLSYKEIDPIEIDSTKDSKELIESCKAEI